jgi:glycine betaine/proline transport system substrate-binding protein
MHRFFCSHLRFHSSLRLAICLLAGLGGAFAGPALGGEPEHCRNVRLATPGWADIDATNALVGVVLKALGYQPKVSLLSVPLTYQGLRSGKVDAFLGNWMPAQQHLVGPLLQKGQIDRLAVNLEKARFTLAVPTYAAEAGVRSFADLQGRAEQFSRRIYGIEAGAPANDNIKRMIAEQAYVLGDWQLVESSDAGLLAQLGHDLRNRRMVVFLAWEPHVINTRFPITYLSGGEAYFGPGGGQATVSTVARSGYREQCPNVGRLLAQATFGVALENEMLRLILDQKMAAEQAARQILQGEPRRLESWLAGVETADGRPGLAVVRQALGR